MDSKVVGKATKDTPNHSQETNFMLVNHEGGPNEMIKPKGKTVNKSAGEKAVSKYRMPC